MSSSLTAKDETTGDEYFSVVSVRSDDGGETLLRRGDFVVAPLSSANAERLLPCGNPPVAQVTALWRTRGSGDGDAGELRAELRTLLRPGLRGAPAKRPYHGSAELVASAASFVEVRAADVAESVGAVSVDDAASFVRRKDFPASAFYLREVQASDAPDSTRPLAMAATAAAAATTAERGLSGVAKALLALRPTGPRALLAESLGHAAKRRRDEMADDVPEPLAGVAVADSERKPPASALASAPPKKEESPSSKKRPKDLRSWISMLASGSTRLPFVKVKQMPRLDMKPATGEERSPKRKPAFLRQPKINAFLTTPDFPEPGSLSARTQPPPPQKKHDATVVCSTSSESEPDEESGEEQEEEDDDDQRPRSTGSFVVSDDPDSEADGVVADVDEDALAPVPGVSTQPVLHRHQQLCRGVQQQNAVAAVVASLASKKRLRKESSSIAEQPQQQHRPRGEGPLPWLNTLRQSFEIYLQFLSSAVVDREFLESMVAEMASVPASEHVVYFRPAIQRIERELLTRKESLVASTVWTSDFQTAIASRPVFRSCYQKALMDQDQNCQACNRSRHSAVFTVSLFGAPYDSHAVWSGNLSDALTPPQLPPSQPASAPAPSAEKPAAEEENEDEDEDEDEDEPIPRELVYRLGKTCHRRANLFHKLQHFKFLLIQHIKKRVSIIADRLGEQASGVNLVTELLDDTAWVGSQYDFYKSLLTEADDFGLE